MPDGRKTLCALLDKYASINDSGFKISLVEAVDEWDAAIKAVGIQAAYACLADQLCKRYAEAYGEEFLFTNRCVAYEIAYHVDAYMAATGHKGYLRHISSFAFSRQALQRHCGVVDIGTEDVADWKQRLMFRYRSGVRPKYRWTERDPFFRSKTISVFGLRKFTIKLR
ncbi:MAG: hypothetical protein IIY70_00285 [Oscillospiraceae bacterium]|nr:hypothetical protein [Oscillospiraceae bacterium]